MTRLGARKKREPQTWTYVPPPPEPPRPPKVFEVWTEEQAKEACAVCLFLMLLLGEEDRDDDIDDAPSWYTQCVEESCQHPMGSFRNVFWWSLRYMRLKNESLDDFRDYFAWKRSQFDQGIIKREGPVW